MQSASHRVLVTGANGFVGQTLCEVLGKAGHHVRAAVRRHCNCPHASETMLIGNLDANTDWRAAMSGVDTVVHLAARVHVARTTAADEELYKQTNVAATRTLAVAAAEAGVRRLVFLSSIKVNGEQTFAAPFTARDAPRPMDFYGQSKWEAEQCLLAASAQSGIQVLAIRSPLVYGPGVRANFLRLLSWVQAGIPLPFASVTNRRSMISVWNLCDLVARAVEIPELTSGVVLASDDEDMSTPELVRRVAIALHRPARLISLPPSLLRTLAASVGKSAEFTRLCGSLAVDISDTKRQLRWAPPLTVDEGLARTGRWYLEGRSP